MRSKSFLIGTLLGPALMSMFIVLPVLVADTGGDDERTIGVVDPRACTSTGWSKSGPGLAGRDTRRAWS